MATRVLDMDERDRVLIGETDDGQVRLIEIDAQGGRRNLAAIPETTAAKYLPGERKVVVQHGEPARLTLVPISGKPRPLLGSPDHATELLGVLPGRIVYRANRRHKLLFTVVIRNVLIGEEQAVYDRGGAVLEAAVSPNSRYIAIRLPRKLVLVDTMPETEDDHVRLISPEPADAGRRNLRWLPGSTSLIATSYADDGAGVVRWTVGAADWTPVVADLSSAAQALVAPDGRRIAVLDGDRVAFHQTANGRFLRAADLPAAADGFVWSPGSGAVAVSTEAGVAIVAADSGSVRAVSA